MCKFHQDVAQHVATDPATGKVDPLLYSIAQCAMARYWIDKYMPNMGDLDGYSPYEMARSQAVSAFNSSNLERDIRKINANEARDAPIVRHAIQEIIKNQALSLDTLNLPANTFLRIGVLNRAMTALYEGDPVQGLNVKSRVDLPRFEPLRRVMGALYADEETGTRIERMVCGSVSRLMTQAQGTVDPRLLAYYERMPKPLRTAFSGCAMHGAGVPVAVHGVTCGLPLLAGSGSGLMLGGIAASFGVPAVAAALDTAMTHLGGRDISVSRMVIVFATAVGISTGTAKAIEYAWPHDHLGNDKLEYFANLPESLRREFLLGPQMRYKRLPGDLRFDVEVEAQKYGLTPAEYLYGCDFSDDLGERILAFERDLKTAAQPDDLTVAKP